MLKKTYYFIFFFLFLFSCGKEEIGIDSLNQNTEEFIFNYNDSTNISIDKATKVAATFKYQAEFFNEKSNLKSATEYELKETIIIPDENDEPAIYVVNFLPHGYIIISATAKETPILGYSDENSFDIENIPLGMAEWFYDRMHKIQIIKNIDDYEIPSEVTAEWESFNVSDNLKSASTLKSTSSGETIVEQYGPLLTTLWSQGVPYNDLVPKTGCTTYSNGRAPTGCVATAIAQVLRYHAHPSTKYNWSIMPNRLYSWDSGTSGANEVAKLMRDVGSYVGMDYGCDGSGANTGDAVGVFKSRYSYSSGGSYAARSDEDAEPLVKADIIASRPVIMAGNHGYYTYTTGWWLWKKTHTAYTNGHAWVCDGYKKVRKTITIRIFGKPRTFNVSNNYYHMNWGWGGVGQRSYDNNGWFLFSNIAIQDPSAPDIKGDGNGSNFQYNRRYLTGIKPR